MKWVDLWAATIYVVLPVNTSTALLWLIGLAALRQRKEKPPEWKGLVLAMASLGTVVGFSTGYSRASVLGSVLPALLTLISGLLAYAVSREGLKAWRPVIPICIVILVFSSLLGLLLGGIARRPFDDYDRGLQQAQIHYEKVQVECEKAKYFAELEIWKEQQLTQTADGRREPLSPTSRFKKGQE